MVYIKHPFGNTIAVPEDKINTIKGFRIDYTRCESTWFGNIENSIKKIIYGQKTIINYARTRNNV